MGGGTEGGGRREDGRREEGAGDSGDEDSSSQDPGEWTGEDDCTVRVTPCERRCVREVPDVGSVFQGKGELSSLVDPFGRKSVWDTEHVTNVEYRH